MDDKTLLLKAAREGNTFILHELLQKDPLLLDNLMLMPLFTETPLHIAALAGKLEFLKLLLRLAPESAHQSNHNGLNELHMAAAKGHVDVVSELLDFTDGLGVTLDGKGCRPLHYAACHGRSEVVRVMVSRNVSLLKQVNFVGETALHVAVKCNQQEVLKVMEELLSDVGNNEFCDDVLMHVKDEFGYSVAKLLVASPYQGNNLFQAYARKAQGSCEEDQLGVTSRSTEMMHSNRLNKGVPTEVQSFMRQFMMITMVLIATVSFQAIITPPPSLWQPGDKTSMHFRIFLVTNTRTFLISCWGLMAAFINMYYTMTYWLWAGFGSALFSYYFALRPLIEEQIFRFVRGLLYTIGMPLTGYVVFYYALGLGSVRTKLKQCLRIFSNSNNAIVPMSSTTSAINSAAVG